MIEMIIMGSFVLVSFILGIRIGQKIQNNEPIEVNPIKIIKEDRQEEKLKKQIAQRESEFDIMIENIDNYDGSAIGQKEIR